MSTVNPAPGYTSLPTDETTPPDCPVRFLVWASRHHVLARLSDTEPPEWRFAGASGCKAARFIEVVGRVWDVMLASTGSRYQLHRPHCVCLSLHEQAVLMALKSLQNGSQRGFRSTMLSILPAGAVRIIEADMRWLADRLREMGGEPVRFGVRDSPAGSHRPVSQHRFLH